MTVWIITLVCIVLLILIVWSIVRDWWRGVPVYGSRSPQWREVRRQHLEQYPTCAACGTVSWLQVHHVVPVHVDPMRECDPTNLITLCNAPYRRCHFRVGHLLSWHSWNVHVREDAAWFLEKVQGRPRRSNNANPHQSG